MASVRLTPIDGMNLDIGNDYFPPNLARYLKNVSFQVSDTSESANNENGAAGKFKPLIANEIYDDQFTLPPGTNQCIGSLGSREENIVLFHNWNSKGQHGLYRLDGNARRVDKVKVDTCWNYQLAPEHFIHEGGALLDVLHYVDPTTDQPRTRSFYMFTDGFNDFRFICIEDAIATDGFNPILFPYFAGNHYDHCRIINAGVPTPRCCIQVTEVPNTTPSMPNHLKYKTWKFYTRYIDVYGRMSEWSEGSDLYIPGGGSDCLSASDALARCVNLTFCAGGPLVDKIDIAFTNCDGTIAYKDTTLFLYEGSNLGDWWLRPRNPDVVYDSSTNEITYTFCNNKECIIVPAEEFVRTQNSLPRNTQSATRVGNFVALSNNTHGFSPLGDGIMRQITASIIPPNQSATIPTREIEIFVPIISTKYGTFQPVYGIPGATVFGGLGNLNPALGPLFGPIPGLVSDWKQGFADNRLGFIGVLAGTDITTVSEQYMVVNGQLVPVNYDNINFIDAYKAHTRFYQRFYFPSVPAGKYIFRILDHNVSLSDPGKEYTSTYTAGTFMWDSVTKTLGVQQASVYPELHINTCLNNYSSLLDSVIPVIYDIAGDGRGVSGYLYEEARAPNGSLKPVELAVVTTPFGGANRQSRFTDHNGFYFVTGLPQGREIDFYATANCSLTHVARTSAGNVQRLFQNDIYIAVSGYVNDYPLVPCNRILIKGKVVQCGTNIGVPGVGVVLSRGGFTTTSQDGTFTIIAHDDAGAPYRTDDLYYVPGSCGFRDCFGDCVETVAITIQRCVSCSEREVQVASKELLFSILSGLLSGGTYGIALEAYDWLGRHTFAQARDELYLTIPTIVDTQQIAPSRVQLSIPATILFPTWVEYIRVLITKELSIADYIDWIVDKVEFVDNAGQVNALAPTQIRIYYGSLNEYNRQNNFNTTTGWQFSFDTVVGSNVTSSNFTNDYVEFYRNGDGTFFPSLTRSRIKYDTEGRYFLIDYVPALANLKANALIRLARPSECVSDDNFFSLCAVIPVVNGRAQVNNITLNAFDTYYLYRQIPVPQSYGPIVNVIRNFGFPFEHHSPSDFWGYKCANFGRPNTRNPYEAEIVFEDQIALSGALSANGQLNYLNYFSESQMTNLKLGNSGGIVSLIADTGVVLVICQNDTAIIGFNDNLVRAVANGLAVNSADNTFGKPERKVGSIYGCSLVDKNTIRRKQDKVFFLDTKNCCLVQSNFSQAVPISHGLFDSWIRPKIKFVKQWNKGNTQTTKYFIGAINSAASEYLLTDFQLHSTSFVNMERGEKVEVSETMAFGYEGKPTLRAALSFTPEYYASLESNTLDVQLFSFKEGKPWFHYTTNPSRRYNNFYGVQCEMVFRVIAVIDPYTKKKPLAMNVLCPQTKFFIDQAVTDSRQLTRVLLEHWKKGMYYSSAPLLCDLNTIPTEANGVSAFNVTEGDMLYGSIIDIRLISDPAHNREYAELLGVELYTFDASPTKKQA